MGSYGGAGCLLLRRVALCLHDVAGSLETLEGVVPLDPGHRGDCNNDGSAR